MNIAFALEVLLIISALVLAVNFYFWHIENTKLQDRIDALGCDALYQSRDIWIPSNLTTETGTTTTKGL